MNVDVAFLIADLSGYTALTEAHGGAHAAKVVARYAEVAAAALRPGARLVEEIGDQLLIVAAEAAVAVETALGLREAVEREPLFPTLRSGIHAGSALEEGGRYYGRTLNLTARVAAHARAGQILCTARVATRVGRLGSIAFQPLGEVRFKGIVEPVAVFEVAGGREPAELAAIDPVCRMQVRPEVAPARLPYRGVVYYFCSFECARAFAARPESYVGG